MNQQPYQGLGTVGSTLLTPLWAKANPAQFHEGYDDPLAAELLRRCGHDPDTVLTDVANARGCLVRTIAIDGVVTDFVAHHPDAVVVTVGIGLCTREDRLRRNPPEGADWSQVEWWGVDTADVVDVRRSLLPEERTRLVTGSVAEPEWVEHIPGDRPTIVVADGLLMYLDDSGLRTLLDVCRRHFGEGTELVGDVMHPWPARSGLHPITKATGARFLSGSRGAAGLARSAPGWEVVAEIDVMGQISRAQRWADRVFRTLLRSPMFCLAHLRAT